ncbi:MAG: ABC transporter permease [Alphaproteobacteria bacterium]|nr:ABC transporter permease [Alphaproteobacteria bacterium]
MNLSFSPTRLRAIVTKEFIQILRDRPTFGMIFIVPIVQLVLFGYAINSDPKLLPTAMITADQSPYVRSITAAMENTGYFRITDYPASEAEAEKLIARGKVQFIVRFPANFAHDLLRGERPALLVEADATDPVATGPAIASLSHINMTALTRDLSDASPDLAPRLPPFEIRVHNRYNPEGITSYNIVPGMIGMVLNMTLIVMTAIAMTRERERGTLESLLATPARPIEVMIGKIAPFIIIGYMQVLVILVVAKILFNIPIVGSPLLLSLALSVYIAANLSIGFTVSTFARNQLQAMQMATFYFLPAMLLSGFMYPFRGMPHWAEAIGNIFPLTYALRIIRGIVLKGNGVADILPNIWPMLLFLLVMCGIALKRYRQTLD